MHMDHYSLPRRIWRILYPVLIFVGIQLVIGVAVEFGMAFAVVIREILRGGLGLDMSAVLEDVMGFVLENSTLIVLVCNIASLAVFLPMWLTMRKRSERYKNRNPVDLGIAFIGFFAGFNIVQLLVFGLTDITRFFPAYEEVAEMLTGGSVLMQIITVGLAAPVTEELVFRGILMNRMKWLPVWASVLIQALLFSIVHFNLFQSLYAFLAGILLGLAYIKYRSVILVILGHVAFNLINIVLSEFFTESLAVIVFIAGPLAAVGFGVMLIRRPGASRLGAGPLQNTEAPEHYTPAP